MVMPGHTCPYGLKALDLLKRRGFKVEDHWLGRARRPTPSRRSTT
jgi:glutaredoxin